MLPETGPVVFPEHFGFCEGVKAADDLLADVAMTAQRAGITKIYGLHEIVHNKSVTDKHREHGVEFVGEIDDIPEDSIVVTSAHGVGPDTVYALEQKGATVFDAACPLVLHTHSAAKQARRYGEKILYVCHGKPGEVEELHDEVLGMVGHLDYERNQDGLVYSPIDRHYLELDEQPNVDVLNPDGKYRIVTQTTLLAEACLRYVDVVTEFIREQQPAARVEFSQRGYICRAVADRQDGVEQLIQLSPRRVVVVTDPNSKNGMGYVDLARERAPEGVTVHAVATADEARELGTIPETTGITASASTPDEVTIAVAQELGMQETPVIERSTFNLRHAKPGFVQMMITNHVERIMNNV